MKTFIFTALLALIILAYTPTAEAQATSHLGTWNCIDPGGASTIGPCASTSRMEQNSEWEANKKLSCDGYSYNGPCLASHEVLYELQIEVYDAETCGTSHYTWLGRPAEYNGGTVHWVISQVAGWVCSHNHSCPGPGGNNNY